MFDFNSTVLIAMAIIFLGAFVQSAIGFGLAVVAAPLLFLVSPEYVPAPVIIVAFFNSIFNAYKYRNSIAIGGLKMAIYGRIPGSIAGGILLLYVSSSILSLWLGGMVLLAVLISLLPIRFEPTANRMAIAGFCSGFMGTSSSIGGPPMALILQHQDASSLRGNLAAFFVLSSFISLFVLYFVGSFHWQHVIMTLPLLPMGWLGYVAAQVVVKYVSKEWIRIFTLVICLTSGVTAIVRGLS
uniref:Probable membrane transporter protein n=2 Tax=Vibrio algicola TaxID=2662262 RepID=A0A5Q0TCW5_9VIBR